MQAISQSEMMLRGVRKDGHRLCWTFFIPRRCKTDITSASFTPRTSSAYRRGPQVHPSVKRQRFQWNALDEGATQPPEREEPEPRQADSEKYFNRLRQITAAESALSNPLGLKKSFEVVQFDADGMGPRDRYVYVEERDCIGCTHCATTATGTFFMEGDHGRARVFDQTGDVEAVVEEAIDTCPVNCIYYVDWTDLIALENMRDGQRINNRARLVGGQDYLSSKKGDTRTTVMDSGIIRCENCPKRGCAECPMYGVGENPEYLRKKAVREAKAKNGLGGPRRTRRRL